MSDNPLADAKAELTKGEAKIKKLIAGIKKLFAKGFLVILLIMLVAIPLAVIITYSIQTYCSQSVIKKINTLLNGKPLFIYAYAISALGVYFSRVVAGSVRTLTKKAKK